MNFGISVVLLLYWGNTKHLEIWRLEIVSSSHHIEQNTFIEASYTNNIHTAEKFCCCCYICRFVSPLFQIEYKKNVVQFWFVCSSLHF